MSISMQLLPAHERKEKPAADAPLGFGKRFTDHMAMLDYSPEKGWHDARIVPFGPLELHPACPVLHYSQEIFEGQKAYLGAQGQALLFRPEENCKRLNESAKRIAMEPIPVDLQLDLLHRFVATEAAWIPKAPASLYLRPTMIAVGASLGAVRAQCYQYFIIASPSGSYYGSGMKPVKIMIEQKHVRAVQGGTGAAKTGGNYAATFAATARAKEQGFDQVLWLDGKENRYIEEVGAMNMVFVLDGKLVTPPLQGSILPGITRKSVIHLAQDQGLEVIERPISVEELYQAHAEGRLSEAFGTGTAAVISPVGCFDHDGKQIQINEGQIGPVAQAMYDRLTGIQWGQIADPYGWSVPVKA